MMSGVKLCPPGFPLDRDALAKRLKEAAEIKNKLTDEDSLSDLREMRNELDALIERAERWKKRLTPKAKVVNRAAAPTKSRQMVAHR